MGVTSLKPLVWRVCFNRHALYVPSLCLPFSWPIIRLMTMSPLYSCGKPCSTGTHNETVKNLTQLTAFDRSNHDRTTALALFTGHSRKKRR